MLKSALPEVIKTFIDEEFIVNIFAFNKIPGEYFSPETSVFHKHERSSVVFI